MNNWPGKPNELTLSILSNLGRASIQSEAPVHFEKFDDTLLNTFSRLSSLEVRVSRTRQRIDHVDRSI